MAAGLAGLGEVMVAWEEGMEDKVAKQEVGVMEAEMVQGMVVEGVEMVVVAMGVSCWGTRSMWLEYLYL